MSTAEILSLISVIAFVVAGVALVLAVLFFIFFKIPTVIGDLSGRTARKSIAKMRAHNERVGGKGFQPSTTNARRGKLTNTMGQTDDSIGKPAPKGKAPTKSKPPVKNENFMPETGILENNKAQAAIGEQTALLQDADGTQLLHDPDATDLLVDENATMPLNEEPEAPPRGGVPMKMLDEVMLIHTDEVIPL